MSGSARWALLRFGREEEQQFHRFPRGQRFEQAGGYKTAANVNTYNARYYEARYLAGLLAGKTQKVATIEEINEAAAQGWAGKQ